MIIKVWIVMTFLVVIGGGVLMFKISEEKKTVKKSDFFNNDLSKIRTDDGKKF